MGEVPFYTSPTVSKHVPLLQVLASSQRLAVNIFKPPCTAGSFGAYEGLVPRKTIGPNVKYYCRVLGGGRSLWARYPCKAARKHLPACQ